MAQAFLAFKVSKSPISLSAPASACARRSVLSFVRVLGCLGAGVSESGIIVAEHFIEINTQLLISDWYCISLAYMRSSPIYKLGLY
jgi:hypothetical protein